MPNKNFSRRDFLGATTLSLSSSLVPESMAGQSVLANSPTTDDAETSRPPKQLAFTVPEYRERVAKIQKEMALRGLDGLLLHNIASICYVTGMRSVDLAKYWLAVIPSSGDPVQLTQDWERYNAWRYAWVEDQEIYLREVDSIAATQRLLIKMGLADKKLGVEVGPLSSLTVPDYRRLKEALPKATPVEAADLVNRVRAVKSPAEIAYLREAAKITSLGMKAAIEAAAEGRTDNDVAAVAYQRMVEEGSEYVCYQPIIMSGRRTGMPHSTFHRVTLRQGDPVFIELGACVERYNSPTIRTVIIGKPSETVKRLTEICLRSVGTILEDLKPGVAASDLAAKCEKAMGSYPSHWLWHGTYGMSVGLGFPPEWGDCGEIDIRKGNQAVMQPGMVFHCSTSLKVPGEAGTAFSETILVTERGCEPLTSAPRVLAIK